MRFLIMNGPNLNLLGIRAPEIYGGRTYADLCTYIGEYATKLHVQVDFYQSNHEGDLIDRIHQAMGIYDGIIFNAGAYTHYSYALHDAIESVPVPVAEVHISNVDAREAFRKISVIRPACVFTISGRGFDSYTEALARLVTEIHK